MCRFLVRELPWRPTPKTVRSRSSTSNSHEIAERTTKAIEELSEALAAGKSETLTQYLAAIGRFHKYSLHNVMLIVLQKPEAAHVAGFHTWHKLGRHVRKGEKGITIFAPMLRRKRTPENGTDPGCGRGAVRLPDARRF
jgi:hypothetical protein